MTARIGDPGPAIPAGGARAVAPERSPEALRKIWKSSEELEGLFVTQLLHASGLASKGFSDGTPGAGIYGGMAEDVLGKALAESADWGVARNLFRSLTGAEAPAPGEGKPSFGASAAPRPAVTAGEKSAGKSARARVERSAPSAPPFAAARAAGGSEAPEAAWPTGLAPFRQAIVDSASASGLDPLVVAAVVERESRGDPRAVSPKGARGLMQIMPGTARDLGLADPFDPVANVRAGTRYLARMMRKFGGDLSLALAAYNAGPGAVSRHGGIPPYRETIRYVAEVLGRGRSASLRGRGRWNGSSGAAGRPIDAEDAVGP